jgi:hypothetical protein
MKPGEPTGFESLRRQIRMAEEIMSLGRLTDMELEYYLATALEEQRRGYDPRGYERLIGRVRAEIAKRGGEGL